MTIVFKNRWWTLGIGLAVVAACGIAVLIGYVWHADSRLDDKLAELRAKREIFELQDLVQEPIAPQDNAATYLARARVDVDAVATLLKPIDFEQTVEAKDRMEFTPRLKAALDAGLVDHPSVVELLETAAQCADANFDFDLTNGSLGLLESVGNAGDVLLGANRILRCRSLEQVAEEHADDALRTAITMFRLARHAERLPTLGGAVYAVGCRAAAVEASESALLSGDIRSETRAQLDAELARIDQQRQYRDCLVSDRAMVTEYFREFYAAASASPSLIWSTRYANDYFDYLTRIDSALGLMETPFRDNVRVALALDSRADAGLATRFAATDFEILLIVMTRDAACVRCLRVLNALIDRDQVEPTDDTILSTLDLPAEVKVDPFDGQPLRIRRLPSGWLVYSIGSDLKDEGGRLRNTRDVGLGPPETWAHEFDELPR